MTRNVRRLGGVAGLVLGLWLASAGTRLAEAADTDKIKEASAILSKLAAAIEKKDAAETKKLVAVLKAKDTDVIMAALGLRSKGGVGWGPKPALTKNIDGIEVKFEDFGKKPLTAKSFATEAENILKAAHLIQAINEVTIVQAPDKDQGQKKKKTWVDSANELKKAADDLTAAAAKNDMAGTTKAINLVNTACQKCHSEWR